MTISELATEAASWFATDTRDDGTEYVKTTEGTPEWVRDLIQEAHGHMFPDDWRYQAIRDVLLSLGDYDAETEGDVMDESGELLDGLVDVYTHDLTGWLHSRVDRYTYADEFVDEFVDEFGCEDADTLKRLSGGQYMEYREILDSVVRSLADELEHREEAA